MFFSFYSTGKNDAFTLMRCEYGSMKIKAKIEWMKTSCFAGLECIATNPSTLATNHLAF